MVNCLCFFFILWGVYMFFYNIIGVTENLESIANRGIYCSEKFRNKQMWCDAIISFHGVVKLFFCVLAILVGLSHFSKTYIDLSDFKMMMYALFLIDCGISSYLFNRKGLKSLMDEIETQWTLEKSITDTHEEEFRYHEQATNVENILTSDLIYILILGLTYLI